MLNEAESKYFEKWTDVQRNQHFHKRIILSLLGLIGILGLIILFAGNNNPLIVEKNQRLYQPLRIEKMDIKPTNESVSELIEEFIKVRYEWPIFEPQTILKKIEPYTTEAFRFKLQEEFGKKSFQNKTGESIEQSVARIRPTVTDKSILASFDRILRINGIPVVVPTEISVLLSEGPRTFSNPLGLYINGIIEHEGH